MRVPVLQFTGFGRRAVATSGGGTQTTINGVDVLGALTDSLKLLMIEHARFFDQGLTFTQFLDQAKAQRDVWTQITSRNDISLNAVNRLKRVRDGLRVLPTPTAAHASN